MKKRLSIAAASVAIAFLLSGCETTQINEMSYAQLQVVAGKIVKICQPYSQNKATLKACYRQEVDREIATRENNRRRARAFAAAAAQGMQNMSDNYARQAQAYAAQRPVNCQTYYSGNYANTNCY